MPSNRQDASQPTNELVIFDCDGVLIGSEPIANRVLAEQLYALNLPLSADEVMRKFVGSTCEFAAYLRRARAEGGVVRELPERAAAVDAWC